MKEKDKNSEALSQDLQQRSDYQFSIFKLNLLITGSIIAFAMKPSFEFLHAVLILPIVSFTLFTMWVHHAFVLYFDETKRYSLPKSLFWKGLYQITFSLSILANFVLFPGGAIFLYNKTDYSLLRYIDYVLLALIFILFLLWYYRYYYVKPPTWKDVQLYDHNDQNKDQQIGKDLTKNGADG